MPNHYRLWIDHALCVSDKQFLWGLTAKVESDELEFVRQRIPDGAWTLFQRMPMDAQRHSININVFYTLRNAYSEHSHLYNRSRY